MKTKILVSVSNDLVSDQRVHKTCMSLLNQGWEVKLVGRKLPNSLSLPIRNYECQRMRLWFKKGALFYAELNIRLFFVLLFSNGKALHSNDLDTLLPNYLVSKIRRLPLVYDSHEYFTEVPELATRPRVQKIWKRIEQGIFPKLKYVFTVNDSIAELFEQEYKVNVQVLKNVPRIHDEFLVTNEPVFPDQKIILLQGAGINIQRGAEELLEAMQTVEGGILLIVGSGDVVPHLKEQRIKLGLEKKVHFFDRMPFEKLKNITQQAYLGVSLDKPTNINYELSLPNKLFDYIHSEVPVLVSNLKELAKVVNDFHVGIVLTEHSPEAISQAINNLLKDEAQQLVYKQNCVKAKLALNWENEEKKLISTYNSIFAK